MRVVLDSNVIISAVITPEGMAATVVRSWFEGAYDLVMSDQLFSELDRALRYRKLSRHISPEEADGLIALLKRSADIRDDPVPPAEGRCADPGDEYLITLAEASAAVIVSGDRHLLDLADELPIFSPRAFLEFLALQPGES
jgi:putative PIN family toxin of toxin-antitoxin system